MAKKFFDLIKSSNFYGPSKPSFQWFATAHGESEESESCDVKSRTNASAVPVRSSILHECRSYFAAQVFRWDSTVNRFLFLVPMSSTSSDFKMNFDSEDSQIYYIASKTWSRTSLDDDQADLFASLSLSTQPPSLWPTKKRQPNTRRWMLAKNSKELRSTDSKAKICRSQTVIRYYLSRVTRVYYNFRTFF